MIKNSVSLLTFFACSATTILRTLKLFRKITLLHILMSILAFGTWVQTSLQKYRLNTGTMENPWFQNLWPGFLFLGASAFSVFLLFDEQLMLERSERIISSAFAFGLFATILYRIRNSGLKGSRILAWVIGIVGLILITYVAHKLAAIQ